MIRASGDLRLDSYGNSFSAWRMGLLRV